MYSRGWSQSSELNFKILKKDDKIGILKIQKTESPPITDYQVFTNVEVSFIKKFRVKASENYRYRGDKLIYSELNRSINDKPTDSKFLELSEDRYILKDGANSQVFHEPEINTNLVRLYFSEPINISRVYCDNQQVMVDLEKLGENRYKIDFPNGVSNTFHYRSGKCVQVDVQGSFFKVKLIKD
ncbi:hypothetical protein E0K83_07520 [Gramella sp. BOM4]|nr:hypothetical protein [Christiangramia bathymodioli]